MAKVTIVLDKRIADKNGLYPIKLRISAQRSNTSVNTGVYIKENAFIGKPEHSIANTYPRAKQINQDLYSLYFRYMSAIIDLERSGRLSAMSAADIHKYVTNTDIKPKEKEAGTKKAERMFMPCMVDYRNQCRTDRTKQGFDYSMKMITRFNRAAEKLHFEDINYPFLTEFDHWMENNGIGIATRGIVFRNIRTIYNYAINSDWVDIKLYPFRKFKIKQHNKEKVYLPEEKMHALLSLDLSQEQGNGLELARDFFLLSFMLCGINPIDLYNLPAETEQISFVRQKIKFHEPLPVHIRLQPEAKYLISQHKGTRYLLDLAEKYLSFESCYHFMKHRLKKLGEMIGCPDITFYWARYTWATYASKIDVSDSTISKALGHTDSTLAEKRYISFDWSKVDKANRRVLDYAFYNEE